MLAEEGDGAIADPVSKLRNYRVYCQNNKRYRILIGVHSGAHYDEKNHPTCGVATFIGKAMIEFLQSTLSGYGVVTIPGSLASKCCL